MYRLFGNAPVGRSNETQMSADRMAIENRKKAREKSGKHQKRRKAPNHESACRRKGRSQRQKMEPGLCMARREFLLYSRARRFAAPCRVGYETGENYGKRRWKAVVENDSGTAYSNRPRRHRFAPWRKSLAVANRLPAVCISFAAFARARFSTADGRLPAAADVAEPSETSDDPASLEPLSEASLRASIRNPNATTSVKAAARSMPRRNRL